MARHALQNHIKALILIAYNSSAREVRALKWTDALNSWSTL